MRDEHQLYPHKQVHIASYCKVVRSLRLKKGMRKDWEELLAMQASSGYSIRSFCDLHGLSEANFYYHRRKQRENQNSNKGFMEVAAPVSSTSTFWAELSYPNGVQLRLGGQVSVDFLVRLLHV